MLDRRSWRHSLQPPLTGKDGQLEAGLTECVTLIVMAAVTLWRRDLLSGLLVALVVFFVGNAIL
jgi:hypothetical protein